MMPRVKKCYAPPIKNTLISCCNMLDNNSVYMQQSVDNHENMQMKHMTNQIRQVNKWDSK